MFNDGIATKKLFAGSIAGVLLLLPVMTLAQSAPLGMLDMAGCLAPPAGQSQEITRQACVNLLSTLTALVAQLIQNRSVHSSDTQRCNRPAAKPNCYWQNGSTCAEDKLICDTGSSLVIDDIRYEPASPRVNEFITTYVTIKNTGSADRKTPFQLSVSGSAAQSIPYLAANESRTVIVPSAFSFPTPGAKPVTTILIESFSDGTGQTIYSYTKMIEFHY